MLSGQLGLEFKIAMGQMGLERQQGPVTWGLGTTLRCLGFCPVGCGKPQQGGDSGRCMFWKDSAVAMWSRGREVAVREEEGRTGGELAPCLLPTQQKLAELQAGKKSLEDQVEMLRIVKEEAEKLEKEAKDQHQKLWEGMSLGGHDSLALGYWPGRAWAQKTCPSRICFLCWLNHAASVPRA